MEGSRVMKTKTNRSTKKKRKCKKVAKGREETCRKEF